MFTSQHQSMGTGPGNSFRECFGLSYYKHLLDIDGNQQRAESGTFRPSPDQNGTCQPLWQMDVLGGIQDEGRTREEKGKCCFARVLPQLSSACQVTEQHGPQSLCECRSDCAAHGEPWSPTTTTYHAMSIRLDLLMRLTACHSANDDSATATLATSGLSQ